MSWYLTVLKKYAVFKGRARRKEYWMFFLFNNIFAIAAIFLDNILGTTLNGSAYGLIYLTYALAFFLPGVAVAVRRLHDIGKSGWTILIALIPIVGGIWLLVLMATDGSWSANEHGPDPKETV